MNKRPYKRRQYLINKKMQIRYMAMVCLVLIAVSGISIMAVYMGIWGSVLDEFSDESVRYQLLTAARITDYEYARRPFSERRFSTLALFKETEALSQRQREIFEDILTRTNQRLAWKLVLLVIVITGGTLFVSHRIAGPLYRIDQCLKKITEGDLSVRGHLRKGDQAVEIMQSFNTMAEGLEDSVKRLKKLGPQIGQSSAKDQILEELNRFRTS